MRAWWWVFILLLVAVIAALGWTWLAADPGVVQIHIRGVTLETSVVVAIAALVVLWVALTVLWRLTLWPFRAWRRTMRRRGRERLVGGLTAFAEGEYAAAERDLNKAAAHEPFRTPALLALAHAAHERGAGERASQALDDVGTRGSRAACALRARFLIENGQAGEALALLKRKSAAGELSARGWRLLVDAALAAGEPTAAQEALPHLARSHALTDDAFAELESRVLVAVLEAASDGAQLDAAWSGASRAQRRRPASIAAYARRAAALGRLLPAMDEIESAQRREWNESLAALYGELGNGEVAARTRKAEAWLAIVPESPALLTTLGRLYLQQHLWNKAEEVLARALALAPLAAAWEARGDARRGRGDLTGAAICYRNALHVARGEASEALPGLPLERLDSSAGPRQLAVEERTEHGVPRLTDEP